ncbi:MAG: hypothetical protein RLZZ176_2272 [Cyanobacteriota bacterium]|jgi:hypothetical protein
MRSYQSLLDDVAYWLECDDSSDNFRFQFLHYLVTGHFSSLNDSIKSKPFKSSLKSSSDSSDLPMIYLDPFCLSNKALQFCIDSCLFIIDVKTLHYFLVSMGCGAIRDNSFRPFELKVTHLDVSCLDFRCRRKYFKIPLQAIASSKKSKLFSSIDTFLEHSDFKDYFLKFLDWDSSLCIY